MFCSSLRKRPSWASLPSTLLSLQNPKWQETRFESHDLQIPVPRGGQEKGKVDMFSIILLSGDDMQPSTNAIARVKQLYHRMGGRNVGVIFLLQQDATPGVNGTIAFMELQIGLHELDIPILPLPKLSSLQTTLSGFQRQLFLSRSAAASVTPPNSALSLLPYCSNGPIPEHARNILSDICHSVPAIAQAATTQDGQAGLRQWFSDSMPHVAEDIIAFWQEEFIVD